LGDIEQLEERLTRHTFQSVPVMTQHYAMLQRNLLYTAVTRGKRLVVLVGQKKAVAIAVRNISGRRRWSKLSEWLRCAALV
jgi:exodeoxyribonuclease V alpha subunit